jgi:hypothetical protein
MGKQVVYNLGNAHHEPDVVFRHGIVIRELEPKRAKHGSSFPVRGFEQGVQIRHELVPSPNRGSNRPRVRLAEHPGFASFRVEMRVASEKRVKRAWVLEKKVVNVLCIAMYGQTVTRFGKPVSGFGKRAIHT